MNSRKFSSCKGEVRIIGGRWHGRKLNFPAIPGLRPTPNRIRETLFNWLDPYLQNAMCLDLFAGSGALGFEALSRGAKSVTFIEQSLPLVFYLKEQIEKLSINDIAQVYHLSFPSESWCLIKDQNPTFNVIFLDPPFYKNLIKPTCFWLVEKKLLLPKSIIYIEIESSYEKISLPKNWEIMRCKIAGQVKYLLIKTTT